MNLDGAVCLVTGASSGIGRATALALAARGATVLAAGRDERALGEVAVATGGQPLAADLGTVDGPDRLADAALAAAGRVDVLVNNAGIGWAGDLAGMPLERLDAVLAVNVRAPVRLTRLLLPPMVERRTGAVAFVTSIAGLTGVAREATYAAGKAALTTFADSLRYEVADAGVTVTEVAPGVIDTPFFARRGAAYDRAFPRPVPAERVATALVQSLERGTAQSVVPRWLAVPARLRGAAPSVYRRLAQRLQ